jgi:hypothetical protein
LTRFIFYAGNSSFEAIETLDPKNFLFFHINDAEDLPARNLTDAHALSREREFLPIRGNQTKIRLKSVMTEWFPSKFSVLNMGARPVRSRRARRKRRPKMF